jgi:hypothetical protein
MQTGSTIIHVEGEGLVSLGLNELVYGCDGCEERTGDPYAHLAWVLIAPDGTVDETEIEEWEFVHDEPEGSGCMRSYCADCARSRREGGQKK